MWFGAGRQLVLVVEGAGRVGTVRHHPGLGAVRGQRGLVTIDVLRAGAGATPDRRGAPWAASEEEPAFGGVRPPIAQGDPGARPVVGGAAPTQPGADRELAGVAELGRVSGSDAFQCADEGGGPLQLLGGKQSQRVAHQNGRPLTAGDASTDLVKAPPEHRECRDRRVRLGLAAPGGHPDDVNDLCPRVGGVDGDRQGCEEERDLERAPT